ILLLFICLLKPDLLFFSRLHLYATLPTFIRLLCIANIVRSADLIQPFPIFGTPPAPKVHLIQHIGSGYLGVMKVIPANREFSAKVELSVLSECADSPFIIQLIDYFTLERISYIFLEYAPFRSLDDLTQLADGIGSEKCTLFALEILLAIQHLHKRRILHRDIKPENVFLLISGHVKLGDFSASTHVDPKTNKARGMCCTYMTRPPEVWNYEHYSYPVDVWAFGISIYNIITNT
ncbi:hypothetical protein EGW08_021379, partial [Elysia chlorotica]